MTNLTWILGEKEAIEHVKIAYERGVNTFDTANLYSNGLSEVYLGNAIKALNLPCEEIVVMTGRLFPAVGKIPDKIGFRIFDSVKKSFERLQLDYIDVLQYHRFDPSTPIEETVQALHDVVKAGYVRYTGMSSCYAWKYYAITNNLTPFISMQNHHWLVYREEEREMFPTLNHFGVGIIPWSPLARGLLTHPFKTDRVMTRGNTDLSVNTTEYLEGAGTKGIVNRSVSLAWSPTRVTAPVIGSTSIKNLEELIKYLEEPYKTRSVMGHA
ncbi:aryl-alcohol dehydrogenase [Lactarius hatsudake]|nr:aryl-alcohol dehydrogenase [Lactarius hatsudake]